MRHGIEIALLFIALSAVQITASAQNGALFNKKIELVASSPSAPAPPVVCDRPVYLTIDTGHMDVAQLMADILNKHQVKATFFVANEKTKDDSTSLAKNWGEKFWAARGKEGHEFASHTWDHPVWRADAPGASTQFIMQPTQGPLAGRTFTWEPKKYCEQLDLAKERIEFYTGKKALPLFRAPGGKTSAKLLAEAEKCGYKHVGWSAAGFLGDELPSERFPNEALLKKALRDIKSGDILMAHLGIWSRKDPWAPTVLEPLIVGLKEQGFCFNTMRQHPAYRAWIAAKGG